MLVERMSYVVFFKGNRVLKKLETLPIDITYVSKKKNFVVIYTDKNNEEVIKKQLKSVKGFKGLSQSQTFDENLNFDVK